MVHHKTHTKSGTVGVALCVVRLQTDETGEEVRTGPLR